MPALFGTFVGVTDSPAPPRAAPRRVRAGLRLQIVLALAGLMLLAFVPLFFAVASLTRATIRDARERAARVVGRAIAAHVADLRTTAGSEGIRRALAHHVGRGGVDAVCVFSRTGDRIACDGAPLDVEALRAPAGTPAVDSTETVIGTAGRSLEVTSPAGEESVVARVNVDPAVDRGPPLVRLVALYMIVFALALLVFAYFSLTRLIVRPVEHLVGAADRVANGARTLRVPRSGARELVDLGASFQAMAEKLISEEAALIVKVEELTDTTRRLRDTRAQLVRSERMASVGRLAAGLAHEIGNPIAALMGMQDLLLDGEIDAAEEKDFLQRMRRETDRIHHVVRDLLDFARPENPSETEDDALPPVADLGAVIKDVVALVAPQKLFRGVELETDVDSTLCASLHASKLTQVLLNLVFNAGAAIASAKREAGRVTIRARRETSDRVRIEVEDDGPGISPSVRDRLFEPFVTTKPIGEGTGLGLAVCRGLIESASGEIGVDPSFDQGARFYVVLPSPKD